MKRICFYLHCLLFTSTYGIAQSANQNLGFELGNFTNWVGYTWRYSSELTSINSSKTLGIVYRRQTIMSDTTAYDANTGNALRMIPAGYLYSARLGDEIISSDSNPRCWQQSLRYTMKIDSSNALLIMKFALVLQYATDHTAKVEPRFRLTIFDKNNDTIPDCSNYDVYSSSGNVKGFNAYTLASSNNTGPSTSNLVKWRDWTTVGANLLKYIGQTITVEFMSTDCTGRYHFGYAYFVAACHPLIITVKYCSGDSAAVLTAPEGFENYKWTDGNGIVVDTLQILKVANPVEGAAYSCTMTSATGCTVTLRSVIAKYVPIADFSSYMLDCKSNKVQFTNLSTTTHGALSYQWHFDDGITATQVSPQYTFSTSGRHLVSLSILNLPSTCVDTIKKEIESFSPPLVGISGDSTYCPNLSVFLKAHGAWEYTWNNGLTTDSIEVKAPGGKFWLIGHSSTGCSSDTIFRTVTEEPDWIFTADGDSSFCAGSSTLLTANGATTYLWSSGDTVNAITVNHPAIYVITGANIRGCKKSKSFNVVEYPLPAFDFTLSKSVLDIKHNQLLCQLKTQEDLQCAWNMGDGSYETGPTVLYTYNISNAILSYTISLMATNGYGCIDSVSKIVDVVPFVPNIFTPNGDELNEFFMPGIGLQVFNREGMSIYKGNMGWDGKLNGKPADPDTYYYLIFYTDRNQQIHTRKGFITLVR